MLYDEGFAVSLNIWRGNWDVGFTGMGTYITGMKSHEFVSTRLMPGLCLVDILRRLLWEAALLKDGRVMLGQGPATSEHMAQTTQEQWGLRPSRHISDEEVDTRCDIQWFNKITQNKRNQTERTWDMKSVQMCDVYIQDKWVTAYCSFLSICLWWCLPGFTPFKIYAVSDKTVRTDYFSWLLLLYF